MSGSSSVPLAMINPVSDANSTSPLVSRNSDSARQPSSSGNSDDVTVTPAPATHVVPADVELLEGISPPPPAAGAGVSPSAGDVGVGEVGVGEEEPSHPQSTPKVVSVARSTSESPGKRPVAPKRVAVRRCNRCNFVCARFEGLWTMTVVDARRRGVEKRPTPAAMVALSAATPRHGFKPREGKVTSRPRDTAVFFVPPTTDVSLALDCGTTPPKKGTPLYRPTQEDDTGAPKPPDVGRRKTHVLLAGGETGNLVSLREPSDILRYVLTSPGRLRRMDEARRLLGVAGLLQALRRCRVAVQRKPVLLPDEHLNRSSKKTTAGVGNTNGWRVRCEQKASL